MLSMRKLASNAPEGAVTARGAGSTAEGRQAAGKQPALANADSQMYPTIDVPSSPAQTLGSGQSDGPTLSPEESGLGADGALLPPPFSGSSGSGGSAGGGPSAPMSSRSGAGTYSAFPVLDWDRYEFISLLGQGGMGAVYKARDRRIGRIVALKFIRGGDERLTQRFMQEARAQSRIEHPGICKVLEVGEVDGKAYIAMQFVDGPSLLEAKDKLSLLEKVDLIREAADALHAAHELGIIHRVPYVPTRKPFLIFHKADSPKKRFWKDSSSNPSLGSQVARSICSGWKQQEIV